MKFLEGIPNQREGLGVKNGMPGYISPMAHIITPEELERSLAVRESVFDRIDAEETLRMPGRRISRSRKMRRRVKARAIRRSPKKQL